MTLAADRWPAYAGPAAGQRRSGVLVAYRLELVKISRLIQVRTIVALGVVGPFLAVAVLHVQSATPGDTAFGQWVHDSGFAIPMVVLGFGAPWVGPVLTAIVAGDIFSSEDRFLVRGSLRPGAQPALRLPGGLALVAPLIGHAPAWQACPARRGLFLGRVRPRAFRA
jgi:hypothetical protein